METGAKYEPARHSPTSFFRRLMKYGRNRSVLMAVAGGIAVVAVACGGGGDDATGASAAVSDTPASAVTAVPQMFDAQGNPMEEPAGFDANQRSDDAVDLDLVTFQHGDFSLTALPRRTS